MDKTALEEKKVSLQQRFESLNTANQQINQTITSNNEELLKLSGEFRLVEELLANWVDKEVKKVKNG